MTDQLPSDSTAAPGERKPRKLPRKPASELAEHWTHFDGVDVFYRESPHPPEGAPVMMHVHGFGLSGRYLLPTAQELADEYLTYVPDLPGFGLSSKRAEMLDIPDLADAAARFLDDRGVERATLVGNSMGCPVIIEFALSHPDRIDRAILVSPAGGVFNQPLPRAMKQLAQDASREPTRMASVAVPDYLRFGVRSTARMFRALTRYPSLQGLLALTVPTLAVLGDRDPLLPGAARVEEIASKAEGDVRVVGLKGAAHAINFSHPEQLAHIIRLFMRDEPIVSDPDWPEGIEAYEIHRGKRTPPAD